VRVNQQWGAIGGTTVSDPPGGAGPGGGTRPRPPGPAGAEGGGGRSTFGWNGATAGVDCRGRAAVLVEQGIISTVSSSVRKSREGVGEAGGVVAKGKTVSSNMTCREMMTRLVERSRQRYPLCAEGYPRKTQAVERGASLCGEVAWRLG
jgi:hypothetical protein